jgi:hypothetical protein
MSFRDGSHLRSLVTGLMVLLAGLPLGLVAGAAGSKSRSNDKEASQITVRTKESIPPPASPLSQHIR